MCRSGLSWNLVIFHPCNNLSKFLTMKWNSMCTWIQYHIIDHSPTYQHWKLFYTKGFCKSSVTDIMKACTEDSKLLVQTRCFLAGSLYLLENLSARQFPIAGTCWVVRTVECSGAVWLPRAPRELLFFLRGITTCNSFLGHVWENTQLSYNLSFFSRCVLNLLCFYMDFSFFIVLTSAFLETPEVPN